MKILGIFACAGILFAAQATSAETINLGVNGSNIPIEVAARFESAKFSLVGPDGAMRTLASGASNNGSTAVSLSGLADGQYRYRVDFAAAAGSTQQAADKTTGRDGATAMRATLAPQEGNFSIAGGRLVTDGLIEAPATHSQTSPGIGQTLSSPSAPVPAQVITGDLTVRDSICVGFDCADVETFGSDTFRLKENNLRIHFDDTSVGTFPSTDWELTANDSANGGANRFSITDRTALTTPFTVSGAAIDHALFVAANGNVGFGTSTPSTRHHLLVGDTPTIRLEQNGGFGLYTWDVAANEANFFIRDVTGGSRLPFRIRPGAPTSSIDIAANGNVSIGSATTAAAKLDVAGDAIIRGTLSQLSSRTAKENFQLTDGRMVLAKLEKMPISTWNYRGSSEADRHLGPVAEDFHEAFGLGTSDHFVAPTDMAGVALASVKALQQEIGERDQRIADLEKRLHDLEILVSRAAR